MSTYNYKKGHKHIINQEMDNLDYTLFFYNNPFYKNVETEINLHFKNVLKTFSTSQSVKNLFTLLIYFFNE